LTIENFKFLWKSSVTVNWVVIFLNFNNLCLQQFRFQHIVQKYIIIILQINLHKINNGFKLPWNL
jgi:hypothetical protein